MDEERAVDEGPWDGNAAMSACSQSDDPARAFAAICAGRREGDPAMRSTWALPHHASPGDPPNAAGVRNSLSRLPQAEGLVNEAAARDHLESHMTAIQAAQGREEPFRPLRDNIVREQPADFELRERDGSDLPVMTGHFSVFNQWTTIESQAENGGRPFRERVAPGAFARTIANGRERMRVMYQHGQDAIVGQNPLGPIEVIREDDHGVWFEVPLLDTDYNRERMLPLLQGRLMNGEKRGSVLGSSFRFRVLKEDRVDRPKRSATNPDGIPERTIQEAEVLEFGPVVWPAYRGATAGVRSTTDDYYLSLIRSATTDALPDAGPEAEPHSDEGTREEDAPSEPPAPEPVATVAPARHVSQDDFIASLEGKEPRTWTW